MLQLLKTDVAEFVEKELIRIKRTLDSSESLLDQREDDEDEEDESMRICRKAFQDIMLQFMRRRQQDHLADILLNSERPLTVVGSQKLTQRYSHALLLPLYQ